MRCYSASVPRSYFSPTTPADLPAARRRRTLLAIAGAIALHILALLLVVRLALLHLYQQRTQARTEIVALASVKRIGLKTLPRSAAPRTHPRRERARPTRQAQPVAASQQVERPQQLPHRSVHARRAPSSALESARAFVEQQRAELARAAARINMNRAPLAVATSAPDPSTLHRSIVDSGGVSRVNYAEAYLLPLEHWFSGDLSCYYVRYAASFSQGGNEKGEIPWPVCYPRAHDELAHGPYPHRLPVPYPQPSYRLPRGTYLTPFMQRIYNDRPQ